MDEPQNGQTGNGSVNCADMTLTHAMKIMDPDECIDELNREISVRRRCFDRWISEGRLGRSEGKFRMAAMLLARQIVETALQLPKHDPQDKPF